MLVLEELKIFKADQINKSSDESSKDGMKLYKLTGSCLLPQDLDESIEHVNKRIFLIQKELDKIKVEKQ